MQIAVTAHAAYGLWLNRNIKRAALINIGNAGWRSRTVRERQVEALGAWGRGFSRIWKNCRAHARHRWTIYLSSAGDRHLSEKPGWSTFPRDK